MAKHFRENKGRSPSPFTLVRNIRERSPFRRHPAPSVGFAKRAKMILMFLCSARTSCLRRWKPPSEVVHPGKSLSLPLSLALFPSVSPFSSLNFRAVFTFSRVEDRESDVVRETSCRCLPPITSLLHRNRFFALPFRAKTLVPLNDFLSPPPTSFLSLPLTTSLRQTRFRDIIESSEVRLTRTE